jgi:two-component system, NtrC family, sensor kinase
LATTFADQAVIAMENARLLSELRESLERQTATSEVLRTVSSSPGELQPVFDTMLAKATELCEASYGALWLRDGDGYRFAALFGDLPKEYEEHRRNKTLIRVRPEVPLARIAATRQPVQVADLRTDPAYLAGDPLPVSAVDVGGIRTLLVVPMFKEGDLIGAIALFRKEVRPFTDKQVDLVSNFGAQAVIAIENARLLNELRESLQQQTATADVLKVISSSPGELEPVFRAMLENANHMCSANFSIMWGFKDGAFLGLSWLGITPEFADYVRQPRVWGPETGLGQLARTRQTVHVPDTCAGRAYTDKDPNRMAAIDLGGVRTFVAVPMLKDGELIGAIGIFRQEVRPFTDKQIELVKNFAAQAVIAIENTRLLTELRQRTNDLSTSLENLRTTQDRLVQTQKLALLGQLTAGIAHEIKNPLNFVNNFSGISAEMIDELREELGDVSLTESKRSKITDLIDTLRGNFDKVVHHGRRADAIVKNMLQHSREGSSEHRVVDVNALVEESLNLAWHGARAETQGFEIKLRQSFDPSAGEVDIFPQDIRRALLNMISNGFYAATRRRVETNGGDYEPAVMASTKNLGDRVEIRIRDNGTGMSPDVKEQMFNPFFTTKPTGEGTGLGLSISHDIIVKQHGGSIEVDTQPGEFTEIRVILPRAAA